VVRLTHGAGQPGLRRGVDQPTEDPAVRLFRLGTPIGSRVAGQQEMSTQMHVDDEVPVLVAHVEQHLVASDAGVVDDDVEAAFTVSAGDHFIGGRPLAYVTGYRDGLATGGLDLVEDVGALQCGVDVVDDDGGPGLGEPDGLRPAEPGSGTGHYRDAAG